MAKIKTDKITGNIRESDVNYRYNQDIIDNTAIIDNFNQGTPWAYDKINSNVYSYSQAYSNNMLRIGLNNTGIVNNGTYHKYAIGKNFIQRIWGKNYNDFSPIFRSNANGDDYYYAYIYNGLKLRNKNASVSAVNSDFDNYYDPDKVYGWNVKAFNNRLSLQLLDTYTSGSNYIAGTIQVTNNAFNNLASDYIRNGVSGKDNSSGVDPYLYLQKEYYYAPLDEFVNVVLLGDSFTSSGGLEVTNGNRLDQILALKYLNTPIDIVNKGIGGDKTADILARLANDIQGHYVPGAVNIVSLMVGINDCINAGYNEATTIANIDAIIDACRGYGFDVILHTITPYQHNTTLNDYILSLNNLIRQRKYTKNVKLVDMYWLWVDKNGIAKPELLNSTDHLHTTNLGIQTWANKLCPIIDSYYSSAKIGNINANNISFDKDPTSTHGLSYKPLYVDLNTYPHKIYGA